MTITIPDIYLAACASYALGALSIIGLAYALTAAQRRRNRRPKQPPRGNQP